MASIVCDWCREDITEREYILRDGLCLDCTKWVEKNSQVKETEHERGCDNYEVCQGIAVQHIGDGNLCTECQLEESKVHTTDKKSQDYKKLETAFIEGVAKAMSVV